MGNTLLLDTQTWDLALDASGNLAIAREPYALAQDAASAIKLFSGELFFDTTQGIPYFGDILGHRPPLSLVKHYLNTAALSVPGVTGAQTYLSSFDNRVLSGQVQITSQSGQTAQVGF